MVCRPGRLHQSSKQQCIPAEHFIPARIPVRKRFRPCSFLVGVGGAPHPVRACDSRWGSPRLCRHPRHPCGVPERCGFSHRAERQFAHLTGQPHCTVLLVMSADCRVVTRCTHIVKHWCCNTGRRCRVHLPRAKPSGACGGPTSSMPRESADAHKKCHHISHGFRTCLQMRTWRS